MEPRARVEAVRRLSWIAGAALLWGACILIRIIYLQVVAHDEYLRLARLQQIRTVEIPAPRGSIFDRTGQPLAMSVPMDSVFVNPQQVPDLEVASEILASILHLDGARLCGRMKWAREHNRGFVWVKRKISPDEAARLRSFKLEWMGFGTESQRHYPKGAVAAHVLGSVDHDESGNAGLEFSLDRELRARPGMARVLSDVKHRGIDSHLAAEPRAGVPLVLTLDERIQFTAEQELARAARASGATSGSVVVMNPHSGEILAMASYPSFDPSRPPSRGENRASRFNNAVSVPFEPGSVFKVITLAAALETTNLRPDTIINCGGGTITLFGRTIHEAKHGFGSIPVSMVLAKSSNIGAIQIGMRVGQERMYDYVGRFGFGQRTNVSLPAESPGLLRKLSRWGKTSLSSVAMGHEVSTTSLQLAQACSVIANGGLLVRPRLILRKGGEGVPSETPRRVLRPETAITMRQMMEGVVLLGTGRRAQLEGYSTGGKTGSAQIFDFASRRYTHNYNASFIGFAPVPNPAIVVAVTVNGTRGGTAGFGGAVAAPVFKAVAAEALRVLDIPKDLPDPPEEPKEEKGQDVNDLAIAELATPESPEVQEPLLAIGSPSPSPATEPGGPATPDFRGMSMRAVLAEASSQGLQVLVDGSGTARLQNPSPGAVLHPGQQIRVQFAR